jgi:hypothetical protein
MFRSHLPRLYELRDLIPDPDSPDAYFQDFEAVLQDHLAKAVFAGWERKVQDLDEDAWKTLKGEASQYLRCRDPRRGWYQLFDILGQADAYKHLIDIGCSRVRFIPRSDKEGRRTPDLEGWIDSRRVLCEVKTINLSDAEIRERGEFTARGVKSQLDCGFFRKLQSDIKEATDQLHADDATGEARHLVYIRIYFDDWVGYYKEDYLRQIDQYLRDNPISGIEIAFRASDY